MSGKKGKGNIGCYIVDQQLYISQKDLIIWLLKHKAFFKESETLSYIDTIVELIESVN